jgi:PAS domain S-box-containing protein
LKNILDNLQDAIFQADLNGNFTYVNPTAIKMYGYTKEELIGKSALMLYYDKNDRDIIINELRKNGRIVDWTGKGLKKDGSDFWVSMNVKFLYDKNGNIIGTEGVVRDISERKKAEIELINNQEILEFQNTKIKHLFEAAKTVLEYENFEIVAEKLFKSCKKLTSATFGYVALISESDEDNQIVLIDNGELIKQSDNNNPMTIKGLNVFTKIFQKQFFIMIL